MTDKTQNPDTRINMMDTPFPMRGDLPKREPGWVKDWNDGGLYKKLRAARQGAPLFQSATQPGSRLGRSPRIGKGVSGMFNVAR